MIVYSDAMLIKYLEKEHKIASAQYANCSEPFTTDQLIAKGKDTFVMDMLSKLKSGIMLN